MKFSPRIEREVRLICEIVRMEEHFDEARLRNERLRLFRFTAIKSRIFPVRNVSLCVTVNDLKYTIKLLKIYIKIQMYEKICIIKIKISI